jgi:putative endonuclease
MENWHVYIIRSLTNDTLYTGIAIDPRARLAAHNAGKGAKYTRGKGPWAIVHVELIGTKGDALRRELRIKKMSRNEKIALFSPRPSPI